MPISFKTDRPKDLTIFTIIGFVRYDEFRSTLGSYAKGGLTKLELYDIREGGQGGLTSEQINQLVEDAKRSISARLKGSKTAIVVNQDVHFGTSRIYQALSEIEGLTWETRVFRSMQDAYEWLGIRPEGE